MELPPSKLSTAASRVWSESAGQFHKKTDVKIDLGLQPTISSSNTISGDAEKSAINTVATEKPSTSIFSSGYIFGSRVFERVTKADSSNNFTSSVGTVNDDREITATTPKPLDVSTIFRRMAQKGADHTNPTMWKTGSTTNGGGKEELKDQLSESANELATKKGGGQVATTADEPITTGEEEEQHLLQISCKFHHYNTESKQWQERGMGTLRLNQHIDSKDDVRLVGRQSGSQRVLINSKVFPEMLLEELSEKRLKISAHTGESDVPQLFLIQASPASIASLQTLLRIYIDTSQTTKLNQMATISVARKRRLTNEGEDEWGREEDLADGKESRGWEGTKKFVKERQPAEDEAEEEEEEKVRSESKEGDEKGEEEDESEEEEKEE